MSEQWEVPEWFTDPKVRHIWIYKNVTEDGAVLSALVKVVDKLRDDVEDCKQKETINQAETNRKLDVVIDFLKPFTALHDSSIQQRQVLTAVTPQGTAIQQTTTISPAPMNPIQWAIANPGKTAAGFITAMVAGGFIWQGFVALVKLAANYAK